MKRFFVRLFTMMIGLFLFALGIIITIKANIGYAPWDVLHAGLARTLGFNIGTMSVLVGLIIVIISALLGETLGLGTIFNMLCIGTFMNLILLIDVIPLAKNMIFGTIMLISGLFVISLGTYYYIKSGFGAGPRDNLMVMLTKKTKLPVGVCRFIIEFFATLGGWLLGGMVGIGTVISVVAIGLCVQITFKVLRFDVTSVKHESLKDTLAFFMAKRKNT